MQSIQTTNAYGDMKPADMSPLIAREIQSLSANTMLRYLPSLNQIWAIAGADVMVFDLRVQNWYKRQFNSPLIDAIPVGEEVLILKKDRVGGVTISLPAIDDKNSKRKKIPDELSRIKSMLHFEPI